MRRRVEHPRSSGTGEPLQEACLLIELANYSHLNLAYGADFARTAMDAIRSHALEQGGQVTDDGVDRIHLRLELTGHGTVLAGPSPQSALIVEAWQLELSRLEVAWHDMQALLVVHVDVATVAAEGEAGDREVPESRESEWLVRGALAPANASARWRSAYLGDMEVALLAQDALRRGAMHLEYQPVVALGDFKVVLYEEALLRFDDLPGFASTEAVVLVLERLGLVRSLDRQVWMTILDYLEGAPEARIGANVSARSLVPDAWWTSVFERLASRPDVASRLTVEFTETAAITSVEAAAAFARRLRDYGCRIALDDFGTRHSSIALARAIKPNVIKIDSEIVHAAVESELEAQTLRSMVGLCQAFASCVVGEGIQDQRTRQVAYEAGLDWGQGYWIVPPHR